MRLARRRVTRTFPPDLMRADKHMETDPLDDYPAMMTSAEVAKYMNTTEGVLSQWRKRGGGPPYVKLTPTRNGLVRYPREQLRAYLAERLRNPRVPVVERPIVDWYLHRRGMWVGEGYGAKVLVEIDPQALASRHQWRAWAFTGTERQCLSDCPVMLAEAKSHGTKYLFSRRTPVADAMQLAAKAAS
jgi:hypothetical protein